MKKSKEKYHTFKVKIMRAPPGAPPIEIKILDVGQSRRRAYHQLTEKFLYLTEEQMLLPFFHIPKGKNDQK